MAASGRNCRANGQAGAAGTHKGELHVFTRPHGKTLIDEMRRGFSGSMPAASFADIYAAGKQAEALEIFGRTSMPINEISSYGLESLQYILLRRGVFKLMAFAKPRLCA